MLLYTKFVYLWIVTPVIYFQRFVHKILYKVDNSTKINDRFHLSGIFLRKSELNYWTSNNIKLVINLATEFPFSKRNREFCHNNGITYKEYSVIDTRPVSKEQLEEILDEVKKIETGGIFINCASGVGRSAMTLIFLLIKLGIAKDLKNSIDFVKSKRSIINLKRGQSKVLRSIFNDN